jgi:excisionase family DNA binding protein
MPKQSHRQSGRPCTLKYMLRPRKTQTPRTARATAMTGFAANSRAPPAPSSKPSAAQAVSAPVGPTWRESRALEVNDVEPNRLCPDAIIGKVVLCQADADFRRPVWLNGRMSPTTLNEADDAVRAGRLDDGYLSLRTLAVYSGLSVRTLRARLIHGARPLPHYRVGGKILVRRTEFDAWMRTFRAAEHNHVDEIVTTLLRSL